VKACQPLRLVAGAETPRFAAKNSIRCRHLSFSSSTMPIRHGTSCPASFQTRRPLTITFQLLTFTVFVVMPNLLAAQLSATRSRPNHRPRSTSTKLPLPPSFQAYCGYARFPPRRMNTPLHIKTAASRQLHTYASEIFLAFLIQVIIHASNPISSYSSQQTPNQVPEIQHTPLPHGKNPSHIAITITQT
jgi:hypothetical protein